MSHDQTAQSVRVTDRIFNRRWLLVAPALLLLWVVGQVDKINVSLVIADRPFLKELNLAGHNSELGGLMSTFFLGYGVGIFLWGLLVDRFGPRLCALCGILAWGALMFMSSRVGGINEFLLLRFLLGLAEGNLWPVGNTLTNRWFPVHEHARAQSFWITGSTLGTAIGVPIVSILILAQGWRGALVFLSAISLIPLFLFYFVSNWPSDHKANGDAELPEINSDRKIVPAAARVTFLEMLRSKSFLLILTCQFTATTTIFTMIQWLPTYLTVFRHVSFKAMAAPLTLGYAIATVLSLAIGYIADRTMQRALTGAAISLGFMIVVLPACMVLSPSGSAVALAALIFVPSALAALNGALIHTLLPAEAIATGTGLYVGVANIASAIGPALFGSLVTFLGGQFWGGFLFLALLNAVGAACYFAMSSPTKALASSPTISNIA